MASSVRDARCSRRRRNSRSVVPGNRSRGSSNDSGGGYFLPCQRPHSSATQKNASACGFCAASAPAATIAALGCRRICVTMQMSNAYARTSECALSTHQSTGQRARKRIVIGWQRVDAIPSTHTSSVRFATVNAPSTSRPATRNAAANGATAAEYSQKCGSSWRPSRVRSSRNSKPTCFASSVVSEGAWDRLRWSAITRYSGPSPTSRCGDRAASQAAMAAQRITVSMRSLCIRNR